VPLLLLLSLLLCDTARSMESRWWSLTAGGETARHADDDPYFLRGATGWTRSLYGSAGAGERWLAVAGLGDQRVRQDTWDWRGIRRMTWLQAALTPAWGAEALGFSTTAFMDSAQVHEWSAGGGLSWCPAPAAAAPLALKIRLARLSFVGDPGGRPLAAELNLVRRTTSGSQRLGLLLNRARGVVKTAGLVRVEHAQGNWSGRVTALLGHQDRWFDAERLVVHDGARELKASLESGMSWRAWKGLSLEGSAGWEKAQGAESRWLFAGLKWKHQVWAVAP